MLRAGLGRLIVVFLAFSHCKWSVAPVTSSWAAKGSSGFPPARLTELFWVLVSPLGGLLPSVSLFFLFFFLLLLVAPFAAAAQHWQACSRCRVACALAVTDCYCRTHPGARV